MTRCWYQSLKRIIDFIVALSLLIALSWLLLLIFLVSKTSLKKPFFTQRRIGLMERPFTLYKFRTLDDQGNPTSWGRFLRSTSLDELPQLINVVKGDMSLVGPRPLLESYLELYSLEQRRRHWLRPGITGWAQVKGRNALSWEEQFALDVWYVDHRSFWLDIKVIFLTMAKLFSGKEETQMREAFNGKN